MIIYEGYFNDKDIDNDELISDVEQQQSNSMYKYYMIIQYETVDDVEPDINKNIRRMSYLFSNIPCISDYYIDNNVDVLKSEINERLNVTHKVHFNVDETSNYKVFNRFIYILKHNLSRCLDKSIPITRGMIGSIGRVEFFNEDGTTVLNNNHCLLIGIYQYDSLYYADTHTLYHIMFPDNKDMHLLDTDSYARSLRQRSYEKVISQLNDSEDVKSAGIHFNIINVSVDDSQHIYVTNIINYISLEVESIDKKVKNIQVDELGRIIKDNILDKIPLNIETIIGGLYIIIKPVNISIKQPDPLASLRDNATRFFKHQAFGNTLFGCYDFPHQHAYLVVTKKDGTLGNMKHVSSMYDNVRGCVSLGICWQKKKNN